MKLYKKDNKDKIRILEIYPEGDEIVQISGLLNGKKTERRSKCKPKNIGKSNETTGAQQAISEVLSKVKKKIRTEYFHTIEEAKNTEIILPMLAQDYSDDRVDFNEGVYVQPKLDGMRLFSILGEDGFKFISRENIEITTLNHIKTQLNDLAEKYSLPIGFIFDGEAYAHGYTFNENMKFIKKYRKGVTETVNYHIYDVVSNKPYLQRFINFISEVYLDNYSNLKSITTYVVNSKADLNYHNSLFLGSGYEGTIIRTPNAGYQLNTRTYDLLRLKEFIDEVYEVIDVLPSEKYPDQAIIQCTSDAGLFRCGMKFSHEERREILINKENYLGKTAEVRFFEYSDDGIPRFPICFGFRLDKNVKRN